MLEALYGFGVVVFICELCQRVSNLYDEINDVIERFDWYLFPHEIQKSLLLIMMVTQKSIGFQCFGSKSANRDTLKRVRS